MSLSAERNEDGMPVRAVPMKVIVAGLHRTGSMSMRVALKILGFNDSYHMRSVMANVEEDAPRWVDAFEGKYTDKRKPYTKSEWDSLLSEAQSCVDLPAAVFSCELAEMYPEAKVVILYRDPERWYKSVLDSVYKAMKPQTAGDKLFALYSYMFDPASRQFARFGMTMAKTVFGYDHGTEKDAAIAWYKAQYDEFRTRIPKDRYVEMQIQDGWKPLCEHLGVPIPTIEDPVTGEKVEMPFPRVNDTASLIKHTAKHQKIIRARANNNLFSLIGRAVVTGTLGYAGYLMWKTRLGGRI